MRFKMWFVLMALSLGFAHAGITQEKQEFTVKTVSGQSVRVHAKADINSPQIASIPSGTTVLVLAVEDAWVKVNVPATNIVGYVSKSLGQLKLATPVESNPVQPRPAAPVPQTKPEPEPAPQAAPVVKQEASKPAPVSQTDGQGQFGVGALFGVGLGGVEPSVLYDLKKYPVSIRGLVNFGTGWSAFGVQGLYRFKDVTNSSASVTVVPFVGGGLTVINIDYGQLLGSQSFKGFLGSGGVFVTLKSLPAIRFSAELDLPVYSTGTFGPAVYGTSLGLGAHYFF